MLEGKNFVAGDAISIADFNLYCECRNIEYLNLDVNVDNIPNIVRWK
jgi:glutathione S-transferase